MIVIVLSLLILTGCPGLADYSLDLPGNYSVVRTSAHEVKIAPRKDTSGWGSEVIPTKVTEVAWNEHYILAKQLGLKEDPNSHNGYQIPNESDVNYWILEIQSGKVFGPFDEEAFAKKRNELGISMGVELKEIHELLYDN